MGAMKTCWDCDEFAPNPDQPFRYCPWCGSFLEEGERPDCVHLDALAQVKDVGGWEYDSARLELHPRWFPIAAGVPEDSGVKVYGGIYCGCFEIHTRPLRTDTHWAYFAGCSERVKQELQS